MSVSIIIPVYNGAEYLKEAIESALAQTIKCEVIVVDDGSTDLSRQIAYTYDVKVIHQVNKGLASARNTGIMNASGEWILPLDADDKLEPNCVETLLRIASDATVVAPSIKHFGLNQDVVTLTPSPTLKDFEIGNRLAYCALIKRDALLEIGGYSPRMAEGYEDLALWLNLLTRGKKIVTTPEPLFLYRVREGSMYSNSIKYHHKLMVQIKKDFPKYEPKF